MIIWQDNNDISYGDEVIYKKVTSVIDVYMCEKKTTM